MARGREADAVQNGVVAILRRWWNDPADYNWLIDFLRPRGLLAAPRAVVGLGGLVMAVALLCLLNERLVEPRWLSHGAVVAILVLTLGWAVFWWLTSWPPAWLSTLLFAGADVGIAVATFVHAEPLAALTTTPLFAMTGAYIVFFHGPRTTAVHVAFATLTIIGTAIWLGTSDHPDAVPLAIGKALIALIVTAAILPLMQCGFWLVRQSAVESLTDPLTGQANRRGLEITLGRRIADADAGDPEPLCVYVIDLDGFKAINDLYGHAVGDEVIIRTAKQIRAAVRRTAVVARTGGEEFVVVDWMAPAAATAAGERIRAAICEPSEPKVTGSVGIATGMALASIEEFWPICSRADDAMYGAKRNGGNRVLLDATPAHATVTD